MITMAHSILIGCAVSKGSWTEKEVGLHDGIYRCIVRIAFPRTCVD